ncbi:hypothetical protein [Caulobacter segnis]|uniref:Uncharacterized protein n=1 Tax=Caulobacter segnis TaxID=88688 RepID=A0A2W5US54_9CAUL|nr:hypothetical protein [Caulobacter segnis]PZR30639.1 MAG: hypothetical protein DI526_21945 [Caulobacter segnis]
MRAIVLSVVLVASPALAQQSPATVPPAQTAPAATSPPAAEVPQALDPLADLIAQSGQDMDEEQAETAAPKPAPRRKPNILPIPAPGEATAAEQVYEMRVRGSIAAAQTLQGPLDGQWRVAGPDGTPLYALLIVDKAGGAAPLEGAWRDLRRTGAPGSTGLIDDLQREGEGLSARFVSREGGQALTLSLRPGADGGWSGQLVEEGAARPVAAEHLLPEAPPGYEARGRGPYVWPPRAAASRPASDAPAACSTKGKKGKALKAAKAKCAAAARKGKASALKKGKASKAKGKAVSRKKRR